MRRWNVKITLVVVIICLTIFQGCGWFSKSGKQPDEKSEQARKCYQQALDLAAQSMLEQAIAAYGCAIDSQPDYWEAFYGRGNALALDGQIEAALADFNQTITLEPDFAAAYSSRALALIEQNNWDAARADIDRALILDPDNPTYLQMLAALDRQVASSGNGAPEAPPADTDDLVADSLMRGQARMDKGQYEQAVAIFDQSLAQYPQAAELLVARGRAYFALGRFDRAKSDFLTAIQIDPRNRSAQQAAAESSEPSRSAADSAPDPTDVKAVMAGPAAAIDEAPAPAPITGVRFPFVVQVAAYRDAKIARSSALALLKTGRPAFTAGVRMDDNRIWHRVMVGAFESRAQANQALAALKQQFPQAWVVKTPVAVDITGGVENLSAALRKQGFLPYYAPVSGNEKRMLVGAFQTKDQARMLLGQLIDAGFSARIVMR